MHALVAFLAWASIGLAFAAPNQAPSVSMTSPASGSTYNAPASITFTANAADSDGTVTRVEFFAGTVSIGAVTVAPYTVTWNAPVGTHSITAKATDNGNKTTTSAAIQVRVIQITTFVTSPPDGAVAQTGFVSVSGTFSGPDTTSVIVTAGAGHSVVASVFGGTFGANMPIARGLNNIEVQVARRDGTSETITSRVTGIDAPVVAIVAPTFWGPYTVPATVAISAEAASADATIARVDFYDGSTLKGSVTASPYTFAMNLASTGNHGILVRAYDNHGFFTDSRTIVLTAQSQPPTVSITTPATGSTFRTPGTIVLNAAANDPDGTVTRVDYYDGGSLIGGATTPPYAVNWVNPSVGTHTLTARATDGAGTFGHSTPISVNIVNNVPPTVDLTAPVAGATYRAPATISFAANAADSDGSISRVDFLLNGNVVATATTPPYTGVANGVPAGNYDATARATDNDNVSTTSTPRSIIVAANVPPTVSITSPANNATFDAPTNMTVAASAADSDGSVVQVEFFAGTTSLGVVSSSPYTVTWNNVPLGPHALTARATDNDGAITSSTAVSITVNGITSVITTPPNGSNYVAPAAFDLSGTVSTSAGHITSIQFFDGATLLQTLSPPPGNATVDTTLNMSGVGAGTHVYTLKGFDSGGRSATSPPVSVNVAPPPTPPSVSLTAPQANAYFIAPAFMRLEATASPGSNPITKVEFFAGTSLIGTANSPPYSVAWSNVAASTYSLTAKATDSAGGTMTSAVVPITVAAAPIVGATPGLDGSTVTDASALVTGTVQTSANSSVTVNGYQATVLPDGRFFANDVPLQPGANSLPIAVTTQDSQTSTQSITITGSSPASFTFIADPVEGVAPLAVSLSVENPGGAPFATIEFDFNMDGTPDYVATTLEQAQAQMTITGGMQQVRVVVKDSQGATLHSATKTMYAHSPVERFQVLRGVFDGMLLRLEAGNVEASLKALSPLVQDRFRQLFNAFGANLSSVVADLGTVRAGGVVGDGFGELVIVRETPQGPRGFIVNISRDSDGIWRIDGM